MIKNRTELILSSIFGFLISLPLTGFLHGFFSAIGNGSFFNEIKGRLLIGGMQAIASFVTIGAPFGQNELESNIKHRLITFLVFLVTTYIIYKYIIRKKRQNS